MLQLGLEPRGDRAVELVAVGNEGVVAPFLACRHVPPGTVRPAFPCFAPFVTKSDSRDCYRLHGVPFRLKAVGAASLLVQVPWKPSDTEDFAAMVPL